ncbi:RPA-related protein RADX isoform X1 [Huso huso]|uniref:RPA-related protein RADX isoform X1 n=1 Tax=Huso huso TaxID=61971 RepID=A0ABR0ZSX6_HUSHU
MSFQVTHPDCPLEKAIYAGESSAHSSAQTYKICREPLYLIALDRYKADPGSKACFSQVSGFLSFLYDATLSDGSCRLRVTLHPNLTPLIQVNALRCGSELYNVEFAVEFDEKRLGPGSVKVQVMNLEIKEGPCGLALERLRGLDLADMPWFGGGDGDAPLKARRSYYLPLWNCEDYFGDVWKNEAPTAESESDTDEQGYHSSAGEDGLHCQVDRTLAALIVRVMKKSRLRHYGKVEQNSECPYQAEFQVADRSCTASLVLWNLLCLEWYRCLDPGVVLKIRNYRMKETYSSRIGRGSENQDQIQIEISLNSRNPTAIISIIPESAVLRGWRLPSLHFNFLTRAELNSSPNGTTCDVIGFVKFVGRPERVLKKGGGFNEFSVYRWVRLEDGTGDSPILLKLESSSQPETHAEFHPMLIAVCTNAQLVSTGGSAGGPPAVQYLTSTSYSQLYREGEGKQYTYLPAAQRLLLWLKYSQLEMNNYVVGGYFSFPPLPTSVEQYLSERDGESCLFSMDELKKQVGRLHYREHRRFTVQGTIITVCYTQLREEVRELYHLSVCYTQLREEAKELYHLSSQRATPCCSCFSDSMLSPVSAVRCVSVVDVMPRLSLCLICSAGLQFGVTCRDFDWDSEEEEMAAAFSQPLEASSPLVWCGRRWQGERLGGARALPETVPREYSYEKRALQTKAAGLQPACFKDTLPDPAEELESFPPARSTPGYYRVTILGLNERLALEAIFIPTVPLSPSPEPYENSLASLLAHGGPSPSTPCPTPEELFASAPQLAQKRFVCVLDISQQGAERLEVVLNRAYPCPRF